MGDSIAWVSVRVIRVWCLRLYMKKIKKAIGLLLLGVVLAGGAKNASALSFECGACVDEPSFVGYTTVEVSGSLLADLGGRRGY
jgi:hypothetical protein